jgi:hypothetical protein
VSGLVFNRAEDVPLSGRPLLIVDADEVLFLFVEGLMNFLAERNLILDLSSYRLHGNIKTQEGTAVSDADVTELLIAFRQTVDSLTCVEGARESLERLSPRMDIVVLSNVTKAQAPARLRNLERHGFTYPLVTNGGLKGPAVKTLAERGGRPVFFVDDIPQQLASAAEEAPYVFRIHLIGDERLKPLLPPAPQAHLRADSWQQAEAFVREHLAEA